MYVRISLILLFCIVTDCYAKNDHLGKMYLECCRKTRDKTINVNYIQVKNRKS